MQTATNPSTGETVVLVGDAWKPAEQVATNDKGQKAYLIGGQWMQDKRTAPAQEKPAFEKEAEDIVARGGATPAEFIAGSPITRFAMGAASPIIGGAQLIANAIGKGEGINQAVRQLDEMRQRGQYAHGQEGFDVAGLAGSALSPVGLAAAKALPVANTLLGKTVQGATLGAAGGVTAPVVGEGDFASQKAAQTGLGATIGGVIPGVATLAGKAGRGVYNAAIEPWLDRGSIKGRAFLDAAGDKSDEVIALLRGNKQLVPGSAPTAGEAAAPAGRAEFSALQESAAKVRPSDYFARGEEQNAARLAAIREVGQDKVALEAAIAQRGANANVNYGAVKNDLINPNSDVRIMEDAIQSRLSSKGDALRDWGRMATEEAQNIRRADTFTPVPGMPRIAGKYSPYLERADEAGSAASDAIGIAAYRQKQAEYLENAMESLKATVGLENKSLNEFIARPSMKEAVKDALKSAQETGTYFPAKAGEQFSVANLQRIKESLDAGIQASKRAADAGRRPELSPAELEGTRRRFVQWLSNKSPGWGDARIKFAEDSAPINQMQVGQYLENKLVPALAEEGKQRPAMFAEAIRNAPQTLKGSLGQPRFDSLSQVLTPDQINIVGGIQADLARMSRNTELAKKGSQAGSNALDLATESIEKGAGGKFPNLLNRGAMIANAVITRLEGKINAKLAGEIAAEMLNPPAVAETMRRTMLRKAENAALAEAISKGVRGSAFAIGQVANKDSVANVKMQRGGASEQPVFQSLSDGMLNGIPTDAPNQPQYPVQR